MPNNVRRPWALLPRRARCAFFLQGEGGRLTTKSTRVDPDAPGVTAGASRRDTGQEVTERASSDEGAADDREDYPTSAVAVAMSMAVTIAMIGAVALAVIMAMVMVIVVTVNTALVVAVALIKVVVVADGVAVGMVVTMIIVMTMAVVGVVAVTWS